MVPTLAEGQKGIVFAATLKLIVPFLVVIPGTRAYNLFRDDLCNPMTGGYDFDRAFPIRDRMAICFFIVIIAGIVLTLVTPMAKPVVMPSNKEISLETSPVAEVLRHRFDRRHHRNLRSILVDLPVSPLRNSTVMVV